jgi:outer membrane lipoprotein SlyB
MNLKSTSLFVLPLLAMAGCVSVPNGPSVTAYPGSGKSFDQFRADDVDCRNFAQYQNGNASDAQADSVVKSAALGTVVGAVAGAAIGGSRGAGVGAGTGLLFGTAAGAGAGNEAAYGTQRRYDQSYLQCMYAKGDKVPVNGRMMSQDHAGSYPPPPPPPPGYGGTPPDYVPPGAYPPPPTGR